MAAHSSTVAQKIPWMEEPGRLQSMDALNIAANLENSAVATGLERSVFIPIPKKGDAKECSNYHTIALISHAGKGMLKILQDRKSVV